MSEYTGTPEYSQGLMRDRRSRFSLVWIIPIIALIITVGMIWKTYINAGTRIYLVIENGDGIIEGKTPLMYKGIKIGAIEDVHIKQDDVSKLELTIVVDKASSQSVTREGNKFWKVEPKISLTEISGLKTIVNGVYIAVMPAAISKDALVALPFKNRFVALKSAPLDIFNPGLSVVVNTLNRGDIAIGAPVLYNKQSIGVVEDKKLCEDKNSVDLYLRIKTVYMDLIHCKSVFFKSSALDIKASLQRVKVHMVSLASFIAGGIVIKNTDESLRSTLASDKQRFSLYDDEESTYLAADEIMLMMTQTYNLTPEISKVYCKGVEAGVVSSLKYDPDTDKTQIKLKLLKEFRDLANESSYFWIVKPSLGFNKVEGLDTIVRGNYIKFETKSNNAKKQSTFVLNENKPPREGLHLKIVSDDIQNLREDAGVFYRNIRIGVVNKFWLNQDKRSFTIDLIIEPKYKKLLNASSLFYLHSGVEFKADFSKVHLKTGSLETILRGGISVITPNFKVGSKLKKSYLLYKSYNEVIRAQYLAENGVHLTLSAKTMGSLKEGSSVFFKQIKVGEILSFKWDAQNDTILFDVFIVEEYANEVQENTIFYNSSGMSAKIGLNGLSIDMESVESLIAGGIAFYTPASKEKKRVRNKTRFKLYDTKDEAMENFIDLVLISEDSAGLEIGSLLKYKNVSLGQVENIRLIKDRVRIDLKVDAQYKHLINKGTAFWLEGFKLSLSGVKNASSALKGSFIVLKPGDSKEKNDVYFLMSKPPMPHLNEKGLRVIIEAKRLGGLKAETPVYYRQIKIGSVIQHRLNSDATKVDIEIFIDPCYSHLIRDNSYFYNTSGIGMEVSLFGAKVQTESIESLLSGGIGVLTPDEYAKASQNGKSFVLHEDFDKNALKWAPKLHSSNAMCE